MSSRTVGWLLLLAQRGRGAHTSARARRLLGPLHAEQPGSLLAEAGASGRGRGGVA